MEVDLSLPTAQLVHNNEHLVEIVELPKALHQDNRAEIRCAIFAFWHKELAI